MISDKNNQEVAIRVEDVSKTFRIPHEKHTSLKSAALNVFEKKTYEEFSALKNINFEIKKGEFFGIIGRNGSGKSTLLKILAGIYVPSKGSVKINGKLSPFLELGVGFNPELTGRENIYLGGSILGLSKKEITKKFDRIVGFSEIEEFIDMKMKNYSSGMQVRLAFSLAINVHAEILLMDEVLAVGDSNFQAKCIGEFNKYRIQGKTVILVTHDIATIQRYCDRAMLLRNGKIMKIGKAEEVGNEYIHQNMSDEEKRLYDQQNEKNDDDTTSKTGKGKSKRIAEITKVKFLDKDGKEKNVFETGDDVLIKIYFKLNEEKKDFNFGVGIYNEENFHVFGTGTIIDKIKNKEVFLKNGYSEIKLKNIQLKNGSYYVKIGIYGDSNVIMYDFLERSDNFKVFGQGKTLGLVEIEHEWQC